MNRVYRLTCMVVGLVCLLGGTPSWAQSWNPTASDSNGNTAGGSFALERHLTSDSFFNTAFGWGALEFNTVADNTAMGSSALGNNSTGEQNTAIGSGALQGNRTGSYNTASGYLALYFNNSGSQNTAKYLNISFFIASSWQFMEEEQGNVKLLLVKYLMALQEQCADFLR